MTPNYSAARRATGPSARSTLGLTSLIISSIERIAALCGVAPTLNEKHICDRIGRSYLSDQLLGHGLDVADQQIPVDLLE